MTRSDNTPTADLSAGLQPADGGCKDQQGVTLLEIIVVMLVIGIVSAVLFSRVTNQKTEFVATAEQIRTHLRYAQGRAMNSNRVWGIEFSASGYAMFRDQDRDETVDTASGNDERVPLPGQADAFLTIPSNMTLTTGIVSFDDWGRPYDGVHRITDDPGATCSTCVTSGKIFQLSMSGTDPISITVIENTGFIE